MMRAELIDNPRRLAAIEAEWWQLWYRVPTSTPFQSPAWLIAWWQAFAPGRLFSVALWRDGRLAGLLPTYVEQAPLERRLLPLGVSVSDYLDVLIDPGSEAPAAEALADLLREQHGAWDVWELCELAADAVAWRLLAPAGCADVAGHSSECLVLNVPTPPADALAAVPAAQRRKLRQAQHRAERRGDMRIEPVDAPDATRWVETLGWLHGARWRERGQAGVMADPRVQRFQAAALPALHRRGLSRCYLVSFGAVPAGAYLGFLHRSRAYAYLGGFDPAFAYESPGTLLIGHAIVESARGGARVFDFLRGNETYKLRWGAVPRSNRRRVLRWRQAHAAA